MYSPGGKIILRCAELWETRVWRPEGVRLGEERVKLWGGGPVSIGKKSGSDGL